MADLNIAELVRSSAPAEFPVTSSAQLSEAHRQLLTLAGEERQASYREAAQVLLELLKRWKNIELHFSEPAPELVQLATSAATAAVRAAQHTHAERPLALTSDANHMLVVAQQWLEQLKLRFDELKAERLDSIFNRH